MLDREQIVCARAILMVGKRLRDRWEYSHIIRAALAGLSFLLLVVVAVTQG
jgi:hypothetical protein